MTINYNLTGKKRKKLAQAVAEILGTKAIYKNVPTFSYDVDGYIITRNGSLEIPNYTDSKEAQKVLDGLSRAGFECESDNDSTGLTISIPLDKVNVENLTKILDAKGNLIKKALGIDDLPIEVDEDTVSFPWFNELTEPEKTSAYTHFIAELCRMSREQSRVTATAKEVENEKYAFRCFLLRLGFIGEDYKRDRKILLMNLTGSSAFKRGAKNANSK